MLESVIVSRHSATIEWLRSQGIDCPVITGNATVADVGGKVVYGNVPFSLAQHAHCVNCVEFSGTPPRGQEYTMNDMIAAGVRLVPYLVVPAANRKVCYCCGL